VKPVKFVFRKLVGEGSDFFGALVPLCAEKFVWRNQSGVLVTSIMEKSGVRESKSGYDSPFYKKGRFKGITLEN
jgi:hypothetical protein